MSEALQVGIDVGSTTVKAVVMDGRGEILWKRYQRHNTRQATLLRDFLAAIEADFAGRALRMYITGSGGRAVAPHVNAQYIQEVNAVTYAVERLCPGTGSVVELGGQDAKVIIWKQDAQGRRSTLTFMNDKCAGGTGSVIDRIGGKLVWADNSPGGNILHGQWSSPAFAVLGGVPQANTALLDVLARALQGLGHDHIVRRRSRGAERLEQGIIDRLVFASADSITAKSDGTRSKRHGELLIMGGAR